MLLIKLLKKYLTRFSLLILFFLNISCSFSPGMSPTSMESSDIYENLDLNFYNIEDIDLSSLPSHEQKYRENENNLSEVILNNEYRYLIGSGDLLEIKVTDIDEINGEFLVDSQGMITLPYAGNILIKDKTKQEGESFLKEILSEYYQDPEISINIKEYNSRFVYVTGEIANPQSILLTDKKLSIVDAILSTGYLKDQKTFDKKALLRRNEVIYSIDLYRLFNEIDTDLNLFLREDDVLHIQQKSEDVVHVFGEAGQGVYPLFQNSSLTSLLSNAKINQITANTAKIYVIREDLENSLKGNVYRLDASNPNSLIFANNFNLLAGDVIFVSPSEIVRWNRVISLITPQSGIFTTRQDIRSSLEE